MDFSNRHKVRQATIDDLPEILVLARSFARESGTINLIGFSNEHVNDALENFLVSEDKFLHVYEVDGEIVGVIGGFLFVSIVAPITQAAEVMWYVKPEYRGTKHSAELLASLEKWAKNNGAKILSMISMEECSPELVDRLYKRRGYVKTESTYVRRL
jgi:GNAT superfamily N-acetyltransferase